VTVVAANVSLPRNAAIDYIDVETAAQLREATIERLDGCDVLLMAAAVADYRPANPADGKIVKEASSELALDLVRTDDVLAEVAERRNTEQTIVGFAAEHGADQIERAQDKLVRKGLDAIVFNDISNSEIGFDSSDNAVTIVTAEDRMDIEKAPKGEIADGILDFVERQRSPQAEPRRAE
jgi:phosphopantothenoylcysteine decarboxylase/phosphopantothenate--cysteine ligase